MKSHPKFLVLTMVVVLLGFPCVGAEPVTPAVKDALVPLPSGSIELVGPIGEAIQT